MDLVEIAKLNEEGMIVINTGRELPLESASLETGADTIWEATATVLYDNTPEAFRSVPEAGYQLKALFAGYDFGSKNIRD